MLLFIITFFDIIQPSSYRLPASGFLYAIKGKANVILDNKSYKIESFNIAHAVKGSCLHISAVENSLEYYLILYKATLPITSRKDMLVLWEREKPVQLQYVFQVTNALTLQEKIETMHREWLKQNNLGHFHGKHFSTKLFMNFCSNYINSMSMCNSQIPWSKFKII